MITDIKFTKTQTFLLKQGCNYDLNRPEKGLWRIIGECVVEGKNKEFFESEILRTEPSEKDIKQFEVKCIEQVRLNNSQRTKIVPLFV